MTKTDSDATRCAYCGVHKKPLVVIEVSGGMVQEVYTDASLDLTLIDWDQEGSDAGAPDHVEVGTQHAYVTDYPTTSLKQMGEDTKEALEKGSR